MKHVYIVRITGAYVEEQPTLRLFASRAGAEAHRASLLEEDGELEYYADEPERVVIKEVEVLS